LLARRVLFCAVCPSARPLCVVAVAISPHTPPSYAAQPHSASPPRPSLAAPPHSGSPLRASLAVTHSVLARSGHGVHHATRRRLSPAGIASLMIGRRHHDRKKHMLQAYISSVSDVSEVCYKHFILMLQK
jgi:hypothetical protein